MIITSSIEIYDTKEIKESLNTKISELSADGVYDYYPTPQLKIVNPLGGQVFYLGSTVNIEWYTYAYQSLISSSLFYTLDGKNKVLISESLNNETSSYGWVIPMDIDVPSTSSKIFISGSYDGKTVSAESVDYFTIASRNIEILDSYVSGAILNKNNVYPIKWKSDGTSGFVDIEAQFGKEPDIVSIIERYPIPDTETYDWTVSTGSNYIKDYSPAKIFIKDSNNEELFSFSKRINISTTMFKSIVGYKTSFPKLEPINAQGIFKYKEYAIEILDDIGSAYARRSRITLTGIIGTPYSKPSVRFVVKNKLYNLILGDIRKPDEDK